MPKKKKERKKILKRKYPLRKKFCAFCAEKVSEIDYKDAAKLSKFISERGKMAPRRISGTCAKHQRKLSAAIKRARHIALLPFMKR